MGLERNTIFAATGQQATERLRLLQPPSVRKGNDSPHSENETRVEVIKSVFGHEWQAKIDGIGNVRQHHVFAVAGFSLSTDSDGELLEREKQIRGINQFKFYMQFVVGFASEYFSRPVLISDPLFEVHLLQLNASFRSVSLFLNRPESFNGGPDTSNSNEN
jgi:hypothetical protein